MKKYSCFETGVVDISGQLLQFFFNILEFEFGVPLGEGGGGAAHGVECGQSEELYFGVFGCGMIGN